jgi:hypothetical protein
MHAAPPVGERAEASGLPGRKIDATPLSDDDATRLGDALPGRP